MTFTGAPVPDGGTAHTEAVTPDPAAAEREASARAALATHRETCAPCRDVSPCTRIAGLRAAWRQALRDASLNHAPADDASGQTREMSVEHVQAT